MVKNRQHDDFNDPLPQVPFARREGSAFGVEVLAFEELLSRKLDHSIHKAHRIEFHILFLVTGGQGRHMVDFVLYPARRGTLIWIAPGQVQHFDGKSDLTGFLILFQPEVHELKVSKVRRPPSLQPADGDFELLETLTELMFGIKDRQLSTPPDRLAWRMLSAVLELWDGAARQDSTVDGPVFSDEFEAFDALLNTHCVEHREVSWYARKLGYSERTLCRWCRRALGVNAKTHIDRRVVLEAKRFLVHTDHSVDSIASRLGFSESTNFVKFFKRIEGKPPSLFRSSYA